MSTSSLEIYVAASAAIPVLWIGIGLSTGAIGAVIRALRTTVSGQIVIRTRAARGFPLELSLSVSPLAISVNGIRLGASSVGIFFGLIVVSGLYGEIVALYALFESKSVLWTRWSVLLSGGVLTFLTGTVLAVSMATIATAREDNSKNGEDGPEDGGDGTQLTSG
jgi:hypothetical protein